MKLDKGTSDYEILKKTIFAEARCQPLEGQKAVAWVIYNRLKRDPTRWGTTLAKVCLKYKQFECWEKPEKIEADILKEPEAYAAIDDWLSLVFFGPDPTLKIGGADHYNNPSKEKPTWASNCRFKMAIGDHMFYRE